MHSKDAVKLLGNVLLGPNARKAERCDSPLPPAIEAGLCDLVAGLMSADNDTRLTLIANLSKFGLPEVLDLVLVRLGHEMRKAKPALRNPNATPALLALPGTAIGEKRWKDRRCRE